MFDLQLDWWQFPLRAALVYFALLAMVRFSGKRTVGQFTPFDLLVVMLLSESVSASLSGGDDSVPAGLLTALSLVALNALLGFASSRSRKVEDALEGRPVVIGRNGKVFDDLLKEHRVGASDMEKSLREADCELEDMRLAILESDGNISVLKKKGAQ